MAARPRKVKIGCYTYPVTYSNNVVAPDDSDVQGYIHYPTKTIAVGVGDGNSCEPAEILLHEIVHGVVTDRCMDRLFASEDDNELFVSSFAKGLLAVLRENKGLSTWLAGEALREKK